MKSLSLTTGLTRKGGIFTGAVMTLATAMVVSMVPTSQAFAYLKVERVTKPSSSGIYLVEYRGHGNSHAAAKADAKKGATCKAGGLNGYKVSGPEPYILKQTWHNGTWFNAIYPLYCKQAAVIERQDMDQAIKRK